MASKNEITGCEIKTKPQSQAYANGWELAFAKKTYSEWCEFVGENAKHEVGSRKMSYKEFLNLR